MRADTMLSIWFYMGKRRCLRVSKYSRCIFGQSFLQDGHHGYHVLEVCILSCILSHRIHGAAIYGHIYHILPSIYPSHVSIYTSTMDPSWVLEFAARLQSMPSCPLRRASLSLKTNPSWINCWRLVMPCTSRHATSHAPWSWRLLWHLVTSLLKYQHLINQ